MAIKFEIDFACCTSYNKMYFCRFKKKHLNHYNISDRMKTSVSPMFPRIHQLLLYLIIKSAVAVLIISFCFFFVQLENHLKKFTHNKITNGIKNKTQNIHIS